MKVYFALPIPKSASVAPLALNRMQDTKTAENCKTKYLLSFAGNKTERNMPLSASLWNHFGLMSNYPVFLFLHA